MVRLSCWLALLSLTLAGCAASSQPPVAQAPTTAPTVAPTSASTASPARPSIALPTITPTSPSATPVPTRPTDPPTPTDPPQPTEQPTLTPLATPIAPRASPTPASRLPTDEVWVSGRFELFAVRDGGAVTQLHVPVKETGSVETVDRPGRTPLVVIAGEGEQPRIFDPARGAIVPLDLPPETILAYPVVSSDGSEVAIYATPPQFKGPRQLLIATIATGAVRALPIHDARDCPEYPENATDPTVSERCDATNAPWPLAWEGQWLYLMTGASPDQYLWRLNLLLPAALPELVISGNETDGYTFQPRGHLMTYVTESEPPQLVDMRTGKRRPFGTQVQCGYHYQADGTTCTPKFSPDGARLAFITNPDAQGATQLVVYDIARGVLRVAAMFEGQMGEAYWLADSKRILVQTWPWSPGANTDGSSPGAKVLIFTNEGAALGEAPRDWLRLWLVGHSQRPAITADDQALLVDPASGSVTLRAIPLDGTHKPRFPTIWLPGDETQTGPVIYVPPK